SSSSADAARGSRSTASCLTPILWAGSTKHSGTPSGTTARPSRAGSRAPRWRPSARTFRAAPMIVRLIPIGLITLVFNLGGGLIAPALPLYARTPPAHTRDLARLTATHLLAGA